MTTPTLTQGRVLRELFVSSRPRELDQHAFPFAAAYLLTHYGRSTSVWVVGILFFLVPYNLTMYGVNDVFDYDPTCETPARAHARCRCSPSACTRSRCGHRRCRACRSSCSS